MPDPISTNSYYIKAAMKAIEVLEKWKIPFFLEFWMQWNLPLLFVEEFEEYCEKWKLEWQSRHS